MKLLNLLRVVIFSVGSLIVSCSSIQESSVSKINNTLDSIFLGLQGSNNIEEHLVFSSSHIQTYSNNQILHERIESVEFKTVTETRPRNETSFFMTIKTLSKDGPTPLSEMAYPEVGEQIQYIISNDSSILKAGEFPKQSLYFIPQLPLPNKVLNPGQTWTYEHIWVSSDIAAPLKLEIVFILKNILDCEQSQCISLEYSGKISQIEKSTIPLKSSLKGTMIYDLKNSQIVQSYQINEEELSVEGTRVVGKSCSETLNSRLNRKPSCDPLKLKHSFTF